MTEIVCPPGWPPPRGYSYGVVGEGRFLSVGGQIGSRPGETILPGDFTAQFALALDNVLSVVTAAGGQAADVVSMTIFVTDLVAYRAATSPIGAIWRERLGTHYPAMALVEVKGLVTPGALVEIQAAAVLPTRMRHGD